MGKVTTVKVEDGDGGYKVINKSEFDEETHVLAKGETLEEPEGEGDDDPFPAPEELDPVEEARRAGIDIPDNWESSSVAQNRALARQIADDNSLSKREEVEAVISAEIARRAASADE